MNYSSIYANLVLPKTENKYSLKNVFREIFAGMLSYKYLTNI